MKKLKPKKSRYKSDIIKKRNQRLWVKAEKVLDELDEANAFTDRKIREEFDELIKTSPVYAEINHLCTEVIPLYEDFKLAKINSDVEKQRLLYSYLSDAEWNQVKDFYTDWFTKQDWQFVDEREDNKFPDKIIVKKADYQVTLYAAGVIDCYILIGKKL